MQDDELFGALEYDLHRYLQVDVRELWKPAPKVTYRQIIVWIRHLPEESALSRRGFGGDTKPSLNMRMAGGQINAVRSLDYTLRLAYAGHTGGKSAIEQVPEPDLIEWEGDVDGD